MHWNSDFDYEQIAGSWHRAGDSTGHRMQVESMARDFLITPAITLPSTVANDDIILSWSQQSWMRMTVLLSPTAQYDRDYYFTDTIADTNTSGIFSMSLNEYAGSTVRIAFVANYSYGSAMTIDDVSIILVADTTHTVPDTVWRMVTVHSADSAMGTVSGGGPCMDSTTVTIRANALQGYEFVAWNDGDTLNPRQVFVVSDTAFTALFRGVEDSVGIAGVRAEEWRLYPNPASTSVTVEVVQPEVLTLLDVSGREVLRKRLSAGGTRVDISALPQGVYFVRLDGNALVKKLIVR